jgi:glucose/arabinose dehydrogenase
VIEIAGKAPPRVLASGLAQPEGIASLADGRLAVAETGTGRLLLLDPATGAIEIAARGLPLGIPDIPYAPRGIVPTGVAVAADGTIFVSSDREGSILRLRPPG